MKKRIDWLYAPVTQLEHVRLAIIGSGPAEAVLKKRFAGTNTTFMGYMTGEELASAYASADVFTFPSDTETLGFVAMEAMASGVPAVGARAGGLPDVIKHGETGYMFTPGDLGDLNAQIDKLLKNPEERKKLGRAARADMELWSWQASTQKVLDYYELARTIHKRYDPPSVY